MNSGNTNAESMLEVRGMLGMLDILIMLEIMQMQGVRERWDCLEQGTV